MYPHEFHILYGETTSLYYINSYSQYCYLTCLHQSKEPCVLNILLSGGKNKGGWCLYYSVVDRNGRLFFLLFTSNGLVDLGLYPSEKKLEVYVSGAYLDDPKHKKYC